jgi:hypothetical protein
LSAIFALGAGADIEGKRIGLNTVTLEHFGNDLRHRQVLENSLVVAELQVIQRRHQTQVVTGQAFTGLTHENIFNTP